MGLKAIVETPSVPGEGPELEEIELPPQDKWVELMGGTAAEGSRASTPASSAPTPKAEVTELQFLGERFKVVPLKFPFVWQGVEIHEVRIARLTIGAVSEILLRPTDVKMTTYDIYSRMTGLPAAVLRGLDSEDGTAVSEAAYDFLPQSLQADVA